jgi:hypothetical protein
MARKNRSVRTRFVAATLTFAALGLGACEEYRLRSDSVIAEHGDAVAHNIAIQTIDPWPEASRKKRIDVDGERILVGVERYKANKSIEPKGLATQGVSTGGGGSR